MNGDYIFVNATDLADRYFREHIEPGLVASGMTEQGIYHLRLAYLHDAVDNPEAVKQLREMYGKDADER